MPIPKREKGEEAQKFMGRCMTSEVMRSEYPNQKQRVAVCVQQSRAGANKFSISEMVQEELVYAKCNEDCGDEEEITESNLVIPEEDEWIDLGVESEEVEVASLWENIRKKKKREGKDYKPAKPGDKDRPQKDAWDRAKGAKYKNKTVKLNKPFRTPKGPKKFSVYVKNEKGNVVKVNFGDPNMEIKRDDPQRRKNFRSRHNCDNPGPKNKARYWSCRMWSSPSVTKITKADKHDSCPTATKDLKVNTKNRDATTKNYNYGPLNPDEPGDYWEKIAKHWDTTVEAAKKSKCSNCVAFDISSRMKECMPGKTSDDQGELGYCWMHHFKCHSARTCHTWAKGGPIKSNEKSLDWQSRSEAEAKDMSYSGEHEMSEQIEVDGYKTRHFDMCPSAQALYKKILSKDLSKRDKDLVSMSVRLQDGLFGLEKMAKNQGKASEQDLVKAMQFATRIMEVADNLGLKEEHSYIKMHVDVVRDLVKKESAEALQYGKPKKNDPRKTPAKPSERKKGSKKNKPKSASKPNKSIKFSEKTTSRLSKMVTEHNKKGKGSKATLGALKAVYRRGAGAFSTSHAPKMSRDGWAMARVRAFLYLLRNGRPSNPNYKQDNDLLPKSHKRSSK
tara:strand:- start:1609 stop:3456 length:1848 start_codon:yes stop_codon:yes gene_type:complete